MNKQTDPRATWPGLAFAGLASMVIGLAACGNRSIPPEADGPINVQVLTIQPRIIQDRLVLDGTVAPVQQVDLVARVAGTLESIHFKDGQSVQKGQRLFTIQQDTYEAELRLNQAALSQARSEYTRQTELMKQNATAQASVDSALSALQQSQANVKLAQINLGYTTIHAPFDGVMGKHTVDAGNYVGATQGGTVLGTITQIAPAYVDAAVGEREALSLRQRIVASGRNAQSGVDTAVVHAQLQGQSAPSESGVLDFIDQQVGQTSGTIALRGRFPNTDHGLLPGLYAKLIIDLGDKRSALVLDNDVLQDDQQGSYVYVVDKTADGKGDVARRRTVEVRALPGEESSEVSKGLVAGERVVVAGQTKLKDGQAVVASSTQTSGSTHADKTQADNQPTSPAR